MPSKMEQYVHRVGRAARHQTGIVRSDTGIAYTFFTRHFHMLARSMIKNLQATGTLSKSKAKERASRMEHCSCRHNDFY